MASSTFEYKFPALRGVQAGRDYFVAMCPLRLIPKLFLFDEEELDPQVRAQRVLNRSRLPELTGYLVSNPEDYVLSSITASIDGDVAFHSFGEEPADVGHLYVAMNASILINDGQHRRAAIEEAIKERPELRDETISVVFFVDAGLRRSQQMFADLNTHAVRPSKSLGILYDHRDDMSQLARRLIETVPCFAALTELEKTSISNRSRKLFTLSAVYGATARFLGKAEGASVSDGDVHAATAFWTEVCQSMPEWQSALEGEVSSYELRRDRIHAHGVALHAIAIAGRALVAARPTTWPSDLRKLSSVDWARSNRRKWEGRALVGGRVSKVHASVVLTANELKREFGLPLAAEESAMEEAHAR